MFKVWLFECWFVGEEGGVAAIDRQPPSSLVDGGCRDERRCRAYGALGLKRERERNIWKNVCMVPGPLFNS